MGRRDRERIARIQTGVEMPRSVTNIGASRPLFRLCKKCGNRVTDTLARRHIKDCWGMDWPEDKPIPD